MACNLVLVADTSSLVTEVLASFSKTFDFFIPEADFPLRDFEKSVYKVFVYHEAIGAASFKVEGRSRRGQLVEQTIAVADSGGSIQVKIFDLAISDVLVQLTFTLLCGSASIVMICVEFEPKGMLVKNT